MDVLNGCLTRQRDFIRIWAAATGMRWDRRTWREYVQVLRLLEKELRTASFEVWKSASVAA